MRETLTLLSIVDSFVLDSLLPVSAFFQSVLLKSIVLADSALSASDKPLTADLCSELKSMLSDSASAPLVSTLAD